MSLLLVVLFKCNVVLYAATYTSADGVAGAVTLDVIMNTLVAMNNSLVAMNNSLVAMNNSLATMNNSLSTRLDNLSSMVEAEKHFVRNRITMLEGCTLPVVSCRRQMIISVVSQDGVVFAATALHNLIPLILGDDHDLKSFKSFSRWYYHLVHDVAVTKVLPTDGFYIQKPCAVTNIAFELGDRVVAYCPGSVPSFFQGHVSDISGVDGLPSDTITVDIPLPSGTCGCGFSNHAQLGIVVRELEVPRPESNSSVFYGRLAPAGAIAGLLNDIISGLAPRLPDLCVEWFGGSAGCWATCCKSWDGRLCLASRIQETRCSAADPGSCQR